MEHAAQTNDGLKYHYKYPRPSVTTDCVVFAVGNAGMEVLLVQRGAEPFKGRWAFPGGFLNMDESAEQGALRELLEETGVEKAGIRQLHTFTDPGRDPRGRVISIAYYAIIRKQEVKGADDAADARWFALQEVPPLAFDHGRMLQTALEELRRMLRCEPGILSQMLPGATDEERRALGKAVE